VAVLAVILNIFTLLGFLAQDRRKSHVGA